MLTGLQILLNENYIALLVLAVLMVIMYAYRDLHIPASKNFLVIKAVIFLMCIAHSLERWALLSPEHIDIRIIASIIHYILQPLVIYLELIIVIPQEDRMDKLKMALLTLPMAINSVIYLISPFTNQLVFWYDENYNFNRGILGYSVYIITFIYIILLIHYSVIYLKSKDITKSIFLFSMVGIALLTGLLEYLDLASGYVDEAFSVGALMYYMYLVNLYTSQMRSDLAQKELELSQSKLSLLRQQIRPHFVFNSLHIIKSLIRSDQAKAITAIEDFSDYLRANVNAIESDKLIPFDDELSLVDSYVSLALADKSKNITVEYDIKENLFRIPPFTVEPIVENAIRHGLRNGGILTLSTRKDGNDIVIVVSDNGLGFEETLKDKGKKRDGTGLENVRIRLAEQCNGTLEISSSSEGTDVTIRLPNVGIDCNTTDDEGREKDNI